MNRSLFIILSFIIGLLAGLWAVFHFLPEKKQPKEDLYFSSNATVGVWWWKNQDPDKYLEFASKNDVDEIYYCDYNLDENTYDFVKKANEKGFKVFALWGEKEWIESKSSFDTLMHKYYLYEQTYADAKLAGVHLDVEPHQFEDFDLKRNEYLKKYIDFIDIVVSEHTTVDFDFDIPFWFNDLIEHDGETKELYKHVIDIANRVFVMSYRDTAEAIFNVAKDELLYAKETSKQIAVCVEMDSDESDIVSFKQESKEIMYNEITKLDELIDFDYLISIHHIKTWEELREVV